MGQVVNNVFHCFELPMRVETFLDCVEFVIFRSFWSYHEGLKSGLEALFVVLELPEGLKPIKSPELFSRSLLL